MTVVLPTIRRRPSARRAVAGLAAATLGWGATFVLNEVGWTWAFSGLGIDVDARAGGAAFFFVYDATKLLLLLVGMVFVVGMLRTAVDPARVRAAIEGRPLILALALAAVLGAVTPFCSCSSIPLFIGFVAAGIPLNVALTFLIASPLVNEVAVVVLGSTFGWSVTAAYVATGLGLAFLVGLALSRVDLRPHVHDFVLAAPTPRASGPALRPTLAERVTSARRETRDIVGRVWAWVLVGVAVGAAIHGWVPEDFFARVAGADSPWAVPVAALAGVPLYSNAASAIPIGQALYAKGVALGTVFAFMMSTAALSLPEAILLRRVLRTRLLLGFFGIVGAGIILIGLAFNLVA